MRVLILANGETPSLPLVQRLLQEHDLILATDGAAHRASELGITPHIICGDFDSVVLERAEQEFPQTTFISTPNQDRADLEKALHLVQERGAKQVTITGAGGGRIDHQLANIALLLRYHTEINLSIVDDLGLVCAVSDTLTLQTSAGDTISLISLSGSARVTLLGVQWELSDYLLPIGTMGVSNVAQAEQVSLEVTGGTVLLCHLPQKKNHT